MTPQAVRDALREAIKAVRVPSTFNEKGPLRAGWELQTSNSFRRIGLRGDGDVLCATRHPIDGHPDLLAAPGVLDYIVAAQPHVVASLLEDIDVLESKLAALGAVQARLKDMTSALAALGLALAPGCTDEEIAKVRALVEKLVTMLQGGVDD